MSTQDDDQQSQGVVWAVLIGVVLLAVSLAIGMGLYRTSRGAAAPGTSTAPTTRSACGSASSAAARRSGVSGVSPRCTPLVSVTCAAS